VGLFGLIAALLNFLTARQNRAADRSLRFQLLELELKLRLTELELERARDHAALEKRVKALEDSVGPGDDPNAEALPKPDRLEPMRQASGKARWPKRS
jgi:hypothetical protein